MQAAETIAGAQKSLEELAMSWPSSLESVGKEAFELVDKYQAVLKNQEDVEVDASRYNCDQSDYPGEGVKNKKKKGIPRPPNSFFIFRRLRFAELREQVKGKNNRDVSCDIGQEWRRLGKKGQEVYKQAAEVLKWEHAARYPLYKYQPQRIREKKKRNQYRQTARPTNPDTQPCIQVIEVSDTNLTEDGFSFLFKDKQSFQHDFYHLSPTSETLLASFEDYFSLPAHSNNTTPGMSPYSLPNVNGLTLDQPESPLTSDAWLNLPFANPSFDLYLSHHAKDRPTYVYSSKGTTEPEQTVLPEDCSIIETQVCVNEFLVEDDAPDSMNHGLSAPHSA
jgi:hypothetical protein